MQGKKPVSGTQITQNLIVAMLAVNNWSLEKSLEMVPALDRAGLFELDTLVHMQHEEIFRRLRNAGYTKSDYVVGLLADRLRDAASVLSRKLSTIEKLLRIPEEGELRECLLEIKGVGPAVFRSFLILSGRHV